MTVHPNAIYAIEIGQAQPAIGRSFQKSMMPRNHGVRKANVTVRRAPDHEDVLVGKQCIERRGAPNLAERGKRRASIADRRVAWSRWSRGPRRHCLPAMRAIGGAGGRVAAAMRAKIHDGWLKGW